MASTSTQTVPVAEPKPVETREPRPVERPSDAPWTIKLDGHIPC